MFRILLEYILTFISLIAASISISQFYSNAYPGLSPDGKVGIIIIGTLAIVFFGENIYLKLKWGRRSKYAQTISLLSSGFSEIHKLHRNNPELTSVRACEILCDDTAKAFNLITGTKCNVAIKILASGQYKSDTREGKALKAITFARSNDPVRKPKENTVKHWIDKNTGFSEIIEKIDYPMGSYFFSNRLPFLSNYLNTSFQVYKNQAFTSNNFVIRYWRWPLPYKSTIIVPICPFEEPSLKTIVGFFCLDSPQIGAFKIDHDLALMQGIADGLYNVLRDASKKLNEST